MQILYQSFLALHIFSFVAAIGTLLSGLAAYNQFWKLYEVNKEQGKAAFSSFIKTRTIGMIALFTAIIAGFCMEWIVSFSHTSHLWFKVKMALVALIFVNGFTMGRTTTLQLQRLASGADSQNAMINSSKLKRNSNIFLSIQLFIFLLIIIMVAFRVG